MNTEIPSNEIAELIKCAKTYERKMLQRPKRKTYVSDLEIEAACIDFSNRFTPRVVLELLWEVTRRRSSTIPDLSKAVEALKNAEMQIEYLHEKFQETGSGNQALAKIRDAINHLTRDKG